MTDKIFIKGTTENSKFLVFARNGNSVLGIRGIFEALNHDGSVVGYGARIRAVSAADVSGMAYDGDGKVGDPRFLWPAMSTMLTKKGSGHWSGAMMMGFPTPPPQMLQQVCEALDLGEVLRQGIPSLIPASQLLVPLEDIVSYTVDGAKEAVDKVLTLTPKGPAKHPENVKNEAALEEQAKADALAAMTPEEKKAMLDAQLKSLIGVGLDELPKLDAEEGKPANDDPAPPSPDPA